MPEKSFLRRLKENLLVLFPLLNSPTFYKSFLLVLLQLPYGGENPEMVIVGIIYKKPS